MVIRITPLAPLDPYIAVADASFRMSKLSISFMLISFNPPEKGIPFNTINGELSPDKERTPRILITELSDPGRVLVVDISTPAARPCKACWKFPLCTSCNSSALIEITEPVTDSLL